MRKQVAGFTLIEVLVAMAIVAIGMAAVLEALSSSANTVSYLRDKTLSEWVALNQIATTRLKLQTGQVPATGHTTGEVDYAGRNWHWRQEVVETQVKGIVRIDVSVRPSDIKAGDDNGWFVTVSGIAGDALSAPKGTTPMWCNLCGEPGAGNPSSGCQPGQLGCPTPTPTSCQPGQLGCTGNPNSNGAGSAGNPGQGNNPGSSGPAPMTPQPVLPGGSQ